ncbi:HAD family hydrolase [Streptomyces sp. NPDC093795]|uniref:HAD family hydrolase n=1 Tax=Streptomyces sp. NPDC093795 TaxID=3366051 RepID=UPI00382A0B2E
MPIPLPPSLPKVLLLDLDGVLVDTRPVMESAWPQVHEAHGLDVPFEEYERHLGRPFADIMEQLGLADAGPIHQTYSKASTATSHLARQFDGVAEVLHAFAAAEWLKSCQDNRTGSVASSARDAPVGGTPSLSGAFTVAPPTRFAPRTRRAASGFGLLPCP